MKILCVSDLHLGDGSKADDFGKNDLKFFTWLASFGADAIYLVGDIFECWQFSINAIEKAHQGLVLCFNDPIFRILKGNHDYSLFRPLTAVVHTRNGDVLISHGFQNDKNMTSAFSRAAIWLVGKVERFIPWLDNPEKWKLFAKKQNKTAIAKNTRKYVEAHAGMYYAVVTGHDHKQKLSTYRVGKNEIIHADCGTCQCGRCEGILIDTDSGSIKQVRG